MSLIYEKEDALQTKKDNSPDKTVIFLVLKKENHSAFKQTSNTFLNIISI